MIDQLVNLTPHPITIYSPTGIHTIPTSGQLARVRTTSTPAGELGGVAIVRPTYGAIEGLPEPDNSTVYIVSGLVLSALASSGSQRSDVVAPGTGPQDGAIRDGSNRIAGVTRFNCL